jgi:hypothetical protein
MMPKGALFTFCPTLNDMLFYFGFFFVDMTKITFYQRVGIDRLKQRNIANFTDNWGINLCLENGIVR